MKKHHERVSQTLFDDWLKGTLAGQSIRWSDSPDPHPDWFLYIDDLEFGVEATTIVPTVKQGRNLVLEPSVSASIHDFIDQVEEMARSEGILRGGYTIALGPMPSGRAFRDRISNAILDYIRQTKDFDRAEPEIVDNSGEYICEVQKVSNARNYLAEWIDLGVRSETEINDDLATRLRDMIGRKSERYVEFSLPTVLLLLDGFHIAEPVKWIEYARKVDAIKKFEAVFRIKPANKPLLLYARLGTWPEHESRA